MSGRRRVTLLIAHLLILFADELSMETTVVHSSSTPRRQPSSTRTCAGRVEASPLGPGTARLRLCNIGNYAYAAYVKIGQPGYGVWLEVDTGSGDTWFISSDCSSRACRLRKRLDLRNSSTTLRRLDRAFNLTYGPGIEVGGELVTDRLCLAEDTCRDRTTLGAVERISQKGMYSDGVIGLGFGELSRFGKKTSALSYFFDDSGKSMQNESRANATHQRAERIFGLRLNRLGQLDEEGDGGELTIGYTNRTQSSSTALSLPLVNDNGGYWMVRLAEMEFRYSQNTNGATENGRTVPLVASTVSAHRSKAILDTGSTYILSSSRNLRIELDRWTERGWTEPNGEHTVTDCHRSKYLPNLRFTFCASSSSSPSDCARSREIVLSPEQYSFAYDPEDSCRRRIGLQFVDGLPFTVLGSTFLSNFHSTFDVGEKRVELAPVVIEGAPAEVSSKNATRIHEQRRDQGAREPLDDFITGLAAIVIAILVTR